MMCMSGVEKQQQQQQQQNVISNPCFGFSASGVVQTKTHSLESSSTGIRNTGKRHYAS